MSKMRRKYGLCEASAKTEEARKYVKFNFVDF